MEQELADLATTCPGESARLLCNIASRSHVMSQSARVRTPGMSCLYPVGCRTRPFHGSCQTNQARCKQVLRKITERTFFQFCPMNPAALDAVVRNLEIGHVKRPVLHSRGILAAD